ncbi:MAG: SURF1 family protein, partial [Thermobispora bispora]|nr:SURF1 family protein [Thermobispora bispora]
KGYWLLTPLRLEDGTLVPVVRGWVPTPTDPAVAVPGGTVTVTGRLRASEETGDVVPSGPLPEGQVALVSTAELINLWTDAPLRSGFIVAASQDPPLAAKPVAAPRPMEDVGFSWRNLAYAVQWWIFAGFAVFMWYHFVREAVRSDQRRRQAAVGREPAATEPTG